MLTITQRKAEAARRNRAPETAPVEDVQISQKRVKLLPPKQPAQRGEQSEAAPMEVDENPPVCFDTRWLGSVIYDVQKLRRRRGRPPKVDKDDPPVRKRKGSSAGGQAKRRASSRQGADPVEKPLGGSDTDGAGQVSGEEYQFTVSRCHIN